MKVIDLAKICHDANKSLCEAQNDHSQTDWEKAPDWQRESAVNGVRFHIANPDAGTDDSHNSWMKEKVDDGWVWGPEKRPAVKEHPCIVPYDQLPAEQQAKDYLFRGIVHSLSKFVED